MRNGQESNHGGECIQKTHFLSSVDKDERGLSSLFILMPMCACGYACIPDLLCSYVGFGVVAVFGQYFPIS